MEWKRGPVIGRGSSATVYLATTATGEIFAVKSTELSASVFLEKERHILSQINCPRIISYVGFGINYIDNKPMYNLFMEYAPFGTISDAIKKHGGLLDECLIRSYTHQILIGLEYLHSNNLVHCDVKCQNILLCESGVKIGDLGCAKSIEKGGKTSAFSGTPVFMAPEVARGEEQGFAADVWGVGCAVIEMATGCNPWVELNDPVSALYRIGYSGDVPEFPRWLRVEAKDFLAKCLNRDAKERWTVKELLQHPFVNSFNIYPYVNIKSKNSPTSILDQDFWVFLDSPEASPTTTGFVNFSGESPMERIRQLIKNCTLCLPNWADEEEWVTVRRNQIEETVKILEQDVCTDLDDSIALTRTESTHNESSSFLSVYVERIGGFDFMTLGDHIVEGDNQNVTIGFVSKFIDSDNMFDGGYLLLDSNLFIFHMFLSTNIVILYRFVFLK